MRGARSGGSREGRLRAQGRDRVVVGRVVVDRVVVCGGKGEEQGGQGRWVLSAGKNASPTWARAAAKWRGSRLRDMSGSTRIRLDSDVPRFNGGRDRPGPGGRDRMRRGCRGRTRRHAGGVTAAARRLDRAGRGLPGQARGPVSAGPGEARAGTGSRLLLGKNTRMRLLHAKISSAELG